MFDEILNMVKAQMASHPEIAAALPPGQEEEVHREIATQVASNIQTQANEHGDAAGWLSQLGSSLATSSMLQNAIQGGLVGTLGKKFNLPPAATGAIAAALPMVLQKFAHKANDPADSSITAGSLTQLLPGILGSLFTNR